MMSRTKMEALADLIHGSEGWLISSTVGTNDAGDLRLERRDEDAVFDSDHAAWEHVIGKAAGGCPFHAEAYRMVRDDNPTERQAMLDWAESAGRWDLHSWMLADERSE